MNTCRDGWTISDFPLQSSRTLISASIPAESMKVTPGEVYQDARTGGFHHRFGGSLLEWIRGREVDLDLRTNGRFPPASLWNHILGLPDRRRYCP
jgi:hypothetical protein